MTIGDEDPAAVTPPGLEVTVYEVIAAPPFETGAVNETTAWALPGTADGEVGASGVVAGVTAAVADDATLVPAALVAVTVKA